MLRFLRYVLLAVVMSSAPLGVRVHAQTEGQSDLDKATQLKIAAQDFRDLGEVIRLSESALEKGLNEENAAFAKTLLASTRIQRGTVVAQQIFKQVPLEPNWPEFRTFALNDLEEGLKLNPDQPQALFNVARLNFLPGGDAERAREALDETIRLSEEEPSLRAKALALRAGLLDDAEKKLDDLSEAIRLMPEEVAPLRGRAAVYVDQGEYEKALSDLGRALELAPDDAAILVARAVVLVELERYDEAMASLDKAAELQPKSAVPLVQKARIHGLQGDFPAALEDLNRAHEVDAANVAVLLLRASVYQELEQSDKSLADVDEALSLRPGLPEAVRLRAMVLAGSGKFSEAIDELEKLQESDSTDFTDQLRLGMFYAADDKPYKAIEVYSKVIEQEPENQFALRGRADALLNVGKQTEAVADYEKALQLDADDPGVLNNLSWVLSTSPDEKLRNGQRALELALKACELTEYKEAHILSTLAAAYAELGDFETAIKWSEKAVEIGDEEQQEALEKELESYKAGEPVRELLSAPKPEEPEEKEETEEAVQDAP